MNPKKLRLISCLFVCILDIPCVQAAPQTTPTIEFRVGTPDLKKVEHARVMVIAPDGNIVATGLTDSSGSWTVSLSNHPQDERFKKVQKMGIATAVVIANGYNEQVVFEVPVDTNAVQPVILRPISPNKRNEPSAVLGNLHRHDIQKFIDTYAQQLGLSKQAPVSGETVESHWSPDSLGQKGKVR